MERLSDIFEEVGHFVLVADWWLLVACRMFYDMN
jgi:hypothetical protein